MSILSLLNWSRFSVTLGALGVLVAPAALLARESSVGEVDADSKNSATGKIHFNRDIRPILSSKCFFCHGPDEEHRGADLRLDVEADAKDYAIVEGDAEASELVFRLLAEDPDVVMPPPESGKSLEPEEIALLRRWIDEGAEYQGHWAFVPPEKTELPEVKQADWPRNAIDHFVLQRLESFGQEPSPEASPEDLIRRVTLDLTGLPPTVQEVQDFLADSSPDRFERTVDRLLASKAYAEHMARHWLDAARYADTNGFQYDLERDHWVWRDWLIHAFDSNMPYDQFTVEQLAGDLLPDATDQQMLATGFHRNHPITVEGGVIDEEYRIEYVMDRVATTSKVWLGLSMECARCHDHKYDPISQKEFYEFFSFFNQVSERGFKGFKPRMRVCSPLDPCDIKAVRKRVQRSKSTLVDFIREHADPIQQACRSIVDSGPQRGAVVVPPIRRCESGLELTVKPDNSLFLIGRPESSDVYELEFPADQPIATLFIEVLADDSHRGGGKGNAVKNNFVLSEIEIAASPTGSSNKWVRAPVARASADYSQKRYSIDKAVDGRIDNKGWGAGGNPNPESQSASFVLEQPIDPVAMDRIRVRLHFASPENQFGRFRVSVAGPDGVPFDVLEDAKSLESLLNAAADGETTKAGSSRDSKASTAASLADLDEARLFLLRSIVRRAGLVRGETVLEEVSSAVRKLRSFEDLPETMVMDELDTPRPTHILKRGEYDQPGERVFAATPAALPPLPEGEPPNRLGLARWLTMPSHPLTARVTANRLWQQLFGTGFVKTASDFGSQGEWPSHVELLDWLAVDFVENGWDVKRFLKQVVMSRTYQQSGRLSPEALKWDSANKWLGRGPSLRLDAEAIRDSVLRSSGLLSEKIGGPSVFPYHPPGLWQEINNRPGYSRTYQRDDGQSLYRRSLYTFWKRTLAPPAMAAFDAPNREYCVVQRSRTNTPLQAFVMLHDPQVIEAARSLAVRMIGQDAKSDDDRIAFGFQACFARLPTDAESEILRDVLKRRRSTYQADSEAAQGLLAVGEAPVPPSVAAAELAAWTTVARTLMNTSEFVTKP